MVDGLGHPGLEDDGLKPPLEEVLDRKGEDVIELVLILAEQAVSIHPAKKSLSLEDPARVLLIQREELPRRVPDPAQSVLNSPQLPLASETVLPHQLELGIEPLLLVGAAWLLERLPICKLLRIVS